MLFYFCTTSIKIGEVKLVKTSGKKPDWVKSDKDFWIKKRIMYFRSVVTNRGDLAVAKREAKGECVKNVAEKINIRVRTEFKQATEGSNINPKTLSNFTSDAITWISENLNIQGLSNSKFYWEKFQKLTKEGVQYMYDVYILTEIPEDDYYKAREMALKSLLKRYETEQNENAKKTAEKIYQKLIEDN